MGRWEVTTSVDREVRALADRHYSRQKPGSIRFVQSGKHITFKIPGGRLEWVPTIRAGKITDLRQVHVAQAGWVSFWPIAEYVRHAWAGAWLNQFFRNESDLRASDLIREAVALTVRIWGEPPDLGMVTMIDPRQVASNLVGYSYIRAGFKHVGQTKSAPIKEVFQMKPERIARVVAETF
jgi:hypothetical protein